MQQQRHQPIKAWKIQERYMANHFKNDPALNGIMIWCVLLHGGDTTVKEKLAKFDEICRKVDENFRTLNGEISKVKDSIKDAKK
jgi:hypothetical protein